MAVSRTAQRRRVSAAAAAALCAFAVCVPCAEARQPPLSRKGQLNVYGPANLALIPELAIPATKLATFKTACYNPTVAGYVNVTAAARAAAASALGINVPAWRAGQRPAFNQLPNGSIYTGQSMEHSSIMRCPAPSWQSITATQRFLRYWLPCHRTHVVNFQQNNLKPAASNWPFILYGDSLTEIWEGTRGCNPYNPRRAIPAVRQHFLSPLARAVGMSGETGSNTIWRVLNGEAPAPNACPNLFQVYTGTNDFPSSFADAGLYCLPAYAPLVASRTIAIVEALRSTCPNAHFILRGLGPKSTDRSLTNLDTWPNIFTVANQHFNYLMKAYAAANPNVHYLVCALSAGTQGYLRRSTLRDLTPACRASPACRAAGLAQLRVDRTKLGDGLHPTKLGMQIQGHCMSPIVRKVLGWNSVSGKFVPTPQLSPRPTPGPPPPADLPPPALGDSAAPAQQPPPPDGFLAVPGPVQQR